MKRLILLNTLVFSLIFLSTSAPLYAEGIMVRLQLINGISFEIPKNWRVFKQNSRDTLEAFVLSHIKLPIRSSLPFAANLYDDGSNTIGIMNIRIYPNMTISQSDVRSLTNNDIIDFDAALEKGIREGVSRIGSGVLHWNGTKKIIIGSKVVLHTTYIRKSIRNTGDRFKVNLYRYLDKEQTFTMTLSYNQKLELLLKPIINRIAYSTTVK